MKSQSNIAILVDPSELYPPSNEKFIECFANLSKEFHAESHLITKRDLPNLKNYSALFIRTLTNVNNYTYPWALLSRFLHLSTFDTPYAIAIGSDKHLQYELCKLKKIRIPETQIIYRIDDINYIQDTLKIKFPLVLKIPNGSFSNGIYKIDSIRELKKKLKKLFASNHLHSLIVQEFIYTDYDWRIGILNHKLLFACKYYMVTNHWQIIKYRGAKIVEEGSFETISIKNIPRKVLECVEKVNSILDDGLYGLDIKIYNNQAYLIEVNDNPNVYFGVEDLIEKELIYKKLLTALISHE